MVELDLTFVQDVVPASEWQQLAAFVQDAHRRLHRKEVPGGDFLGWLDLPSRTLATGLTDILAVAQEIQSQADALVVVGIGGSYLGAHAGFAWGHSAYYNQLSKKARGGPELYFAGNHLSGQELESLLTILEGKNVYINVISKSGTTTEPAVAFRILRNWLVAQVGAEQARKQIIATTDEHRGALRKLAEEEGYRRFVIPDDVGGRYSVLTPVGLLPLAAVGTDIQELLKGAVEAERLYQSDLLEENAAYRYAAVRNALYRKGKTTEIFAHYEPALHMFGEWWKQLFGESEGKDAKGIYPASVGFTTDLHSMGQYIQEGMRNLFETVVTVKNSGDTVAIPSQPEMEDGLEYLANQKVSWVNDHARLATQLAHHDGGVPNLLVTVPDRTDATLGKLFYFFEKACAMSGLLNGVNPFNQPGVEAYKTNMFALLGKPGYEKEQVAILNRLEQLRG